MNCRQNPSFFGHQHAISFVEKASIKGRLPPSLLLEGPKGVGKATFAYHLVRYVFSGMKSSFLMDPQNPLFQRVAYLSHGDLCVVEPDHEQGDDIAVKEVRRVSDFFSKTALEGGWRIAIIDGVNSLNRHGANSLLKIVEEPPHNALLILISHGNGNILPTLKSRCQRLHFGLLSEEDVDHTLRTIEEKLDQEKLGFLKSYAAGKPGQASRFLESGYGLNILKDFLNVLTALRQGNVKAVCESIDRCLLIKAEQGDIVTDFYSLWQWWMECLIQYKITHKVGLSQHTQDLLKAYEESYGLEECVNRFQSLKNIYQKGKQSFLDSRHVLTCMNLEFLKLTPRENYRQ